MKAANWKPRDSRIGGLGPMLGLLLLAVLLPTAGVLWFMGQAMRNERLVVRQKLEDSYSRQLAGVREQVDGFWRDRLASLAGTDATAPPQQVFGKHVTMERSDRERADCVVLYGPDSRLLYPEMAASTADTAASGQRPPAWGWAEHLEYIENNPLAAATAYADATEQASDIHISAQALHAQARCLVKAEQRDAGLNILIGRLAGDPRYHDARDPRGRLLALNAQLYALELIAILVAGLGVVSTLITLIHDRKREVALLALLGATARQLRRMVVIEAVLIGAVSQLVGVVMGVLLAVVLIYVINVQSFGWTIQFHLPVVFLLQSTLLILAATALCGLFPAMRAARVDALQTVREE